MATLSRASRRVLPRVAIVAAVIGLLAACQPMNSAEATLFVATNNLRKQYGLAPYAQQEQLMAEARSWAAQMAASGTLAHSDPGSWNVSWTAVAENVGVSGTIDDIINRLEASPEHRANMLSTKYTHMAVGTARGKDGRLYAAQLFWHA